MDIRAQQAQLSGFLASHPLQVRARYNQLQPLFVTMADRELLHARRQNATSSSAPHAVRARGCSMFYLQVREFSGEAPIVAVLCLKVLNLLLAVLPVHSAFLGDGGSESSNKHYAPKTDSYVRHSWKLKNEVNGERAREACPHAGIHNRASGWRQCRYRRCCTTFRGSPYRATRLSVLRRASSFNQGNSEQQRPSLGGPSAETRPHVTSRWCKRGKSNQQ
jgi:hypothetical protein